MFQHREFYFHNYNMDPTERYISDHSMHSSCDKNTPQHPCNISPELKFQLLVDLVRPYLQIQGKDMTRDKIIADQVINVCALANHASFDMFSRIGYELIRKNINFDLKCPLKKVSDRFKLLTVNSYFFTYFRVCWFSMNFTTISDFCSTSTKATKPIATHSR